MIVFGIPIFWGQRIFELIFRSITQEHRYSDAFRKKSVGLNDYGLSLCLPVGTGDVSALIGCDLNILLAVTLAGGKQNDGRDGKVS